MNKIISTIVSLGILFSAVFFPTIASAQSVLRVNQGGTGASTFGVGLCLKGNGTSAITASSCSSGGAGTGTVSTSTPLVSGQVDFSTGVNTIGNDSTFLWDNTLKQFTSPNNIFTLSTTTSATTTNASFTKASTTNFWLDSVGTASGTFLAADAAGKIIATTTPFSQATTTIYIDQNSTKSKTDGTPEFPYKTVTSAVKSYPATYIIAPGTYNEASCGLTFSATSTIFQNQAAILCWSGGVGVSGAGNINFSSGIIWHDPVIALGNVAFTDTALSDPATVLNGYLGGGNLTLSGLSTVQGGQLIGGEIYTKPGSLTAFSFNEINDLIGVAGTANFDTLDLNVSAVGSGKYALTSTTTGVVQINGMSLTNTAANGGGIYCKGNGATATQPNVISALGGQLATTTNSGAINCSNVSAGPYTITSTTNGQRLYVNTTSPLPFSFLQLITEGTTTLAQNGGFVGIGTTTPARNLDVVGTSAGTTLTSASLDTISLTNTDQTNNNYEDMSFLTVDSAGSTVIGAKMSGVFTNHTTGAVSADLAWITKNGGTTGERMRLNSWGALGIGTSSPQWLLQLATSTRAQLTLSDAIATDNHWSFRNAGGVLYIATSSPSTFATSSVSALTIDANGQLTIPFNKGVGCGQFDANGALTNTGTACGSGSGGGNSKWATSTSPSLGISPNSAIYVGVGTTTPRWPLQVATSTTPQVTLSTGTITDAHLSERWVSGSTLYIATSSPTTFATSTTASLTLDTTQAASLAVGSSTPSFTSVNGLVTLGSNGANGTTTVSMGKLQFDGYNSAGSRYCLFVNVAGSLTTQAGACTQ